MDVRMPDGTIITGVPDNITQTDLLARYNKFSTTPAAPAEPVTTDVMGGATGIGGLLPKPSAPKPVESFDPTKPLTAESYMAAVEKRKEENPERSISDAATDAGITLLKGAIGLPESFVGLADIPSRGAIGKFLEEAGYKPREAKEILDTYLSEAQQAANRKVAETKGFIPTIGAVLENPSTLATGIGESLPQMIGGAGVARGILKAAPSVGAVIAGGLGEGVLGAGSAAEQIRGENKDKLLTGEQALAALGSGVGTAAFGIAGGRLANKFGLDDIDTMLAAGSSRGGAKSVLDFAKRATGSGISEGAFEEMPQSAQEKMWMNYATDKPLMEGVPEAMGVGLTTGFAMGALGGGAGSVLKTSPTQEKAPSASDYENLARSKGFLAPEATAPQAPSTELLKETEPTKAPKSESQDLEAMLAELEAQLEGKPVKAEPVAEAPAPVAPVVEAVTPAAPVTQEPSITELKSEEPVTPTFEPEVVSVETEMTPQERLRRANVSMFNAQRMLANGKITADQYDDLNRQYAEIKLRASDIAQRAAEPIVPAVEPKGEYQETKSLDTFFAKYKEDKKRLDDLPKYGQPEVKQVVADLNQAIQKVTDAINAKGYSADAIKHKVPAELRPLFDQFSTLTGGGSRLLMESERVGNNKKLAKPEKLAKAIKESRDDVANAYKLLGIEPEAAQPAVQVTPPRPVAPAKPVDKASPLRKAAYAKNPFMTFLADKGLRHEKGVSGSLMSEFNGGKQKMVSGHGPIFKKTGLQIDELLPLAIQDGYLPPDATEDQLYALIQKAFGNNKVEPVYSEQGQEDLAKKYEERMAEEEPAYEERAAQSDAAWLGMSEAEYEKIMAREISNASDEDFADLDQAVEDATQSPASNTSMRAAMEALGFTEQEIQDEENRAIPKANETLAGEPGKGNEASQAAPTLELETQTAEELKAKQAEIDRLNKENERLSKQAEAKAKADAERDEFVLTGSDRAADVAAAQGQQDIFGAMEEEAPAAAKEEPKLSKSYELALDESTKANEEYSKALLDYRAGKINDDQFLVERKKHDLAVAKFDQAFNQEQARPAAEAKLEVASEVVGPAEKPAAPQLTREPITIEGEFTEIGEEKQRILITDQTNKLSDAQVSTLEKFYGFARDTEEFANAARQDVVNFITKGATYVNGKIRAIIRSMANGVLSVAVAFNPQFISQPVNVVVPAYETRTEQVTQPAPADAERDMSPQARRAYEVLYPALKDELIKENKLFLITDKPTAMQFIFNPDGTLLMKNKVLLAKGIGDFEKGDNNIDANKITPAGVRTLVKRFNTTSTEGYDFNTVFGTMGVDEKTGGTYFSTVYHSVYTHLPDAQKRLQALKEAGPENSRYSFGCINVDKATFETLVKKHSSQMDGATLFVVPDNDQNVMNFINGEATHAKDIVRRKVEPVTKQTKVEVQRAAEAAAAERNVVGKEEEGPIFYSIEPTTSMVNEEKKRSPSFKRQVAKLNRDYQSGKISSGQLVNEVDWALKQAENERLSKDTPEKKRGYLELVNRLSKAAANGDISQESFELATWFMRNNPALVEDLGVSIRSKGEEGVGGQYLKGSRVMRLIKEGSSNLTVTHEILHHLERMMPAEIQQAIRSAWSKQLLSAQKKAKTPAEQLYFKLLFDAHYMGDNFDYIDVPSGEMSKVFMQAMAELDFNKPGSKSSMELASTLLKMSLVPIQNYQYFNPSEFWAVNGSEIVQGRFEAVQGGVLARLKNWLKELGQIIKGFVGMNSNASIIKALDSLSKADGKFVTKDMLGEGEYKSIRRNYEGNEAPASSWESPEESKMDTFIYKLQDKLIDTKRVIESIKKTAGDIADNWDAYMKEELYHGRTAKRTQDFLNREMLPILEEMKDKGVTLGQFEEYLHMRHAEERNALVAARNPKMPDQGSGVTSAQAAKYLANLSDEQNKTFESLASKFDKIINNTQKLLVSSGLETQDTIDAWNQAYEHYVPLMRDDLDFKHHGTGLGSGYSTKGGSSKSAVGSTKKVIDIFANVALQRERAIVRSEKARVGRALYGLAIKNPNPGFWLPINPDAIKDKEKLTQELIDLGLSPEDAENIIQEPKVASIDKKTGLVKYQVNPLMRNSDNVFPVRINGEDRYIFFNTSDERAVRMVESLKNLDAEQMGVFLGSMGTATRWLASVNTQFNPVFGAWNFVRDVQGAAFNLTTTEIAGQEKEVMSGVLPALRGIYSDLRKNRKKQVGEGEWAKLFEQYQMAGGQTGYRDQFNQAKEKASIVQRELDKLDRGSVSKAAHAVFNWLSDYNDAMENAVRLSAFKVALDKGLSEERAASIAKNLTVNFNRKGAGTPTLQALYAFFNAAVQGSARLAQTLRGPAGKKIMAGGIAIGVFQALALAMAGYDDEDPPEFLKNKNLILPIPGGDYLIVPMPLGFNIFPGVGRLATEYVLGQAGMITGAKGAGDKLVSMGSLILDAFNPLGSGSVLQMAAPTIADPWVSILGTNRDAFGRPISKEDRATAPTPGYTRSRETASAFSKAFAEFLNYVSSPIGTKYTKGLISPTADQIDYLIGQYTGGVGREIMKAGQYGAAVVNGETGELPSYKVPIVGKMFGETESPAAVSAKFYDNVTKLAEHENEIKMRIKNKENVQEYRAEHPEVRFINRVNNLENQITAINKQKKALQEQNAPEERIKRLDERKTRLMKQFNDQIKNLERE